MLTTANQRPGHSARQAATTKVASVVAVAGYDDGAIVALAASVARGLAPALATAILEAAREREISVEAADDVHESTPVGVVASVNGRSVLVGAAALFDAVNVSLGSIGRGPERLRRRGEHVMFVSIDGQVAGFFGVVHARD
jgi:Cu+-exporting ATPase